MEETLGTGSEGSGGVDSYSDGNIGQQLHIPRLPQPRPSSASLFRFRIVLEILMAASTCHFRDLYYALHTISHVIDFLILHTNDFDFGMS